MTWTQSEPRRRRRAKTVADNFNASMLEAIPRAGLLSFGLLANDLGGVQRNERDDGRA